MIKNVNDNEVIYIGSMCIGSYECFSIVQFIIKHHRFRDVVYEFGFFPDVRGYKYYVMSAFFI